jgi:hypothetical protein
MTGLDLEDRSEIVKPARKPSRNTLGEDISSRKRFLVIKYLELLVQVPKTTNTGGA